MDSILCIQNKECDTDVDPWEVCRFPDTAGSVPEAHMWWVAC